MEGKRPRGRRRLGMLAELYKKESYGTMKRRAEDIGYCGNVGCHEPASRQITQKREYITNKSKQSIPHNI